MLAALHALGADFWPLAVTRELDDLILDLRTNEPELGTWVFRTAGDADACLAHDAFLLEQRGRLAGQRDPALPQAHAEAPRRHQPQPHRADRAGQLLRRLAARARARRRPQLHARRRCSRSDATPSPRRSPSAAMNLGPLPMGNGLTRLQTRFLGDDEALAAAHGRARRGLLAADAAATLGLVTFAPDDIDWDDEVRIALEERASFSPDALTGMEANYRFAGPETMETKIFGRLTAWQNWIFNRPNAVRPRRRAAQVRHRPACRLRPEAGREP